MRGGYIKGGLDSFMIEIQHVTKRYGNKLAVNDVSFSIQKGEILGFLGRNGAGKTTTMNIITGYISATSGTVMLDGYDILDNPREVKRRIGYLPEMPPLYLDMTVNEYLRFVCAIKDVKRSQVAAHLKDWIEAAGITKHITFHCFRHTFATLQLAGGTDIYTVSKLLTHSNLATTQVYAEVVSELKRDASERISLKEDAKENATSEEVKNEETLAH